MGFRLKKLMRSFTNSIWFYFIAGIVISFSVIRITDKLYEQGKVTMTTRSLPVLAYTAIREDIPLFDKYVTTDDIDAGRYYKDGAIFVNAFSKEYDVDTRSDVINEDYYKYIRREMYHNDDMWDYFGPDMFQLDNIDVIYDTYDYMSAVNFPKEINVTIYVPVLNWDYIGGSYEEINDYIYDILDQRVRFHHSTYHRNPDDSFKLNIHWVTEQGLNFDGQFNESKTIR